jgi:hypothetical protein
MDLKTMKNIEIFRVGKWHGTDYAKEHLNEMVRNFHTFKDSWFRPALKPGHYEKSGEKAAGYLSNLRRKGDVLMADLVDLPTEIYTSIQQHSYDRVSIEIVPELEREGKVYRCIVWALALLGAEVPAVSGLKPLRAMLSSDTEVLSLQTALQVKSDVVALSAAHINGLPDAAFAAIESGEKTLRHLPHHYEGVTDPSDNDTIDFSQLENALSELDQAQISDELKNKAKLHLEKHARSFGIWPAKETKMKVDPKDTNVNSPDLPKDTVDMNKEMLALKAKVGDLSTKLEASNKHALDLEEKSRKERVARKLEELRIPALRPYAEVFYNLATSKDSKPIKFSLDGKETEMVPESIVDEFVTAMNKVSESLLNTHSNEPVFERDDSPPNEDPSAEVDRRVKKRMSAQKDLDYSDAFDLVMADDPKLKEQYARI